MLAKTLAYWAVICLLSAVGAVFGVQALNQQFGLRDLLGLRAPRAAPARLVSASTPGR